MATEKKKPFIIIVENINADEEIIRLSNHAVREVAEIIIIGSGQPKGKLWDKVPENYKGLIILDDAYKFQEEIKLSKVELIKKPIEVVKESDKRRVNSIYRNGNPIGAVSKKRKY